MTKMLLLAGAAALAAAMPAAAKPGGNGNGQGKAKSGHVMKAQKGTHARVHSAKSTKAAKSMRLTRAQDRNRNGLLDADERLARKYGGALCPPGLAKKTPACTPPGQAKRVFS